MKFDLQSVFTAKYAQWIMIVFIFICSLLILSEWSSLFFSLSTTQSLPETVKDRQVTTKHSTMDTGVHSPLFGVYVSDNLSDIKKSMLNITLVGILFAPKVQDSQVIIRGAHGEEKTYKLGDSVPGGAVITRIMASGILVAHHGVLESLSLPKHELIFEPVAKPLNEE